MLTVKRTQLYLKRKSQLKDPNANELPLKAVLQYAGVLLTLATALLYLFGYVYYETYISYWGLSENLFPLSRDKSIIHGLFRSLFFSTSILPKLVLVMGVLMAVMIATVLSTYRPFIERLSSLFSRFKRKAKPAVLNNVSITPEHDKLMNIIALMTCGLGLLVFVPASIFFTCQSIVDNASKDAAKKHDDIISGKESSKLFSSLATLHVKNEAKTFDVYSGHLIMTSTTHAALYSKNKGMMIFPLANVARIDMSEKAIKGNGKVSP